MEIEFPQKRTKQIKSAFMCKQTNQTRIVSLRVPNALPLHSPRIIIRKTIIIIDISIAICWGRAIGEP